jgi:hypothetical protein
MSTVINNPSGEGTGSGVGAILGVIIAIVLIALFFIYGLPALRGGNDGGGSLDVNVDLPSGGGGGTSAQ